MVLAMLAARPGPAQQLPPATPSSVPQDEGELITPQAPPSLAPDTLSQAGAAEARGDPAEALSRYLRVLAARPDDLGALIGAGHAALQVGDVNAAAGFYARAETIAPRDGVIKVGLAMTLLQRDDPRGALRLFREAVGLGMAPAAIAADRGLAYDLRGDTRRAQADYALALQQRRDDETVRRLAISQAIGGDRAAALMTLDPLLRRQDVPAWRARAFVLALTGDAPGAADGAALVMSRDQVDLLTPYLPRLAALKAGEKAAAIHLGRFPGEGAPTRVAAGAPPPLVTTASAMVNPFAPYSPPGATAGDDARAREQGLTDALADARARAAARARVPAAIRAKGATLTPFADDTPSARLSRSDRYWAEQARREEEKATRSEKSMPGRHWVQVAGGANRATLPRAWEALKAKWPKQLAGRSAWATHYRHTNRLLIGPFASSDAAQDWVSEHGRQGLHTFRVETDPGDAVEPISG